MAILHFDPPRCNFIRVRKTGTTSVIRGLFGGQDKAVAISRSGEWLPAFDGHFTFAFVRNPFDRMASCLRMFESYQVKNAAEEEERAALDMHRLMDVIEDDSIRLEGYNFLSKLRSHAVPITHSFYKIERADFIGRFENFERDYRAAAERIGIPCDEVPHMRASTEEPYDRRFTPETRKRAEALLRDDLERFDYRFGA